MLSLDEARARLASRVTALPAVHRPLEDASGLRLAASPLADADLPPADLAAMDGYAARDVDLAAGTPLPVAFVVPAGAAPGALPAGAAARIFTGAVVPAGADTVVPQEDAELLADGRVHLDRLPAGSHVRRCGEIFRAGAVLGRAGEPLNPARIAALAAGGATRVSVVPRPRVALLVTGAELVDPGATIAVGQIRDSNGPLLTALAREARLTATKAARVADELPGLRARLESAVTADLIVSSGGVSVGDFDLVPRAVAELGGEVVFHKVAIQPGKPILVARLGAAWLVALPGNPVSALVGWRMFARPLAEALAGDAAAFAEAPLAASLAEAATNRGTRTQLRPAVIEPADAGWRVRVRPWKGSHDILAPAPANALARLEPGAELAAGALVLCFPLPWRWAG